MPFLGKNSKWWQRQANGFFSELGHGAKTAAQWISVGGLVTADPFLEGVAGALGGLGAASSAIGNEIGNPYQMGTTTYNDPNFSNNTRITPAVGSNAGETKFAPPAPGMSNPYGWATLSQQNEQYGHAEQLGYGGGDARGLTSKKEVSAQRF